MHNLLDKIETKQKGERKERHGIIDFVSKKQVIFYDLTHDHSPRLRILIISWKVEAPELRFSVYASINHPGIPLPDPLVIPRSIIQNEGRIKQTRLDTKVRKL